MTPATRRWTASTASWDEASTRCRSTSATSPRKRHSASETGAKYGHVEYFYTVHGFCCTYIYIYSCESLYVFSTFSMSLHDTFSYVHHILKYHFMIAFVFLQLATHQRCFGSIASPRTNCPTRSKHQSRETY